MAIKLSTEQKIQAAMAGHDDWACVGSFYNPHWTTPCVCGHGIKTVFVIGHAGDHGPAYTYPTLHIGSECFKHLTKDPKFLALSQELQEKRREIEKIQRQMRQMRENQFHGSEAGKAFMERIRTLGELFRFAAVERHGFNYLSRAGVDSKALEPWINGAAVFGSGECCAIRSDLRRFQDEESAQECLNYLESRAKIVVEGLRPHAETVKTFVEKYHGSVSFPGVAGATALLTEMEK